MDVKIVKDLEEQKLHMLERVEKEAAWEQAKCQISFAKLSSK